MKPSERTSEDYLRDILEYAEKAELFLASVPSAEELARDEKTLLAVIRALDVIGEASKRVAPALRKGRPEIPWRGMAGMRDKVIHGYFGVDAALVWRTVKDDLPRVREAVRSLLPQ